jgi:hypothetical protein
MSCEIVTTTEGRAILMDTTTDWAFGPVFDSPEDAGAFCAWLGTDPRNIMLRAILDGKEPDAALEARYLDWRIHQQQAGA